MKRILLILLVVSLLFVSSCNPNSLGRPIGGYGTQADGDTPNNDPEELPEEMPVQVFFNVTLDYNDGSMRREVVKIPEGSKIDSYVFYPVSGYSEVVAWSGSVDGVAYDTGVYSDLTLYAQWVTHEPVIYDENFPSIINDRVVIIRTSGASDCLYGKTLKLGANVRSITLDTPGIYFGFSILVLSRLTDININLNDFSFQALNSSAINGEGEDYTVNLNVIGSITVDCLSRYTNSTGERGYNCIVVPNLKIFGGGTLSVFAGDGYSCPDQPKAGAGSDGRSGESGQHGGIGIIADTVTVEGTALFAKGGDGGNGGDGGDGTNNDGLGIGNNDTKYKRGGNGGDGGNGGNAILCSRFIAENAHLDLRGGIGGNGGDGGEGGGTSDFFAGYGGDGGDGGDGGSIFGATESNVSLSGTTEDYTVGVGGNCGRGGYSAHSSKGGSDGWFGSSGRIYK